MLITHFRSLKNINSFSDRAASFLLILVIPLLVTGPFLPDFFLSLFCIIFITKLVKEKGFIYEYNKILIFFFIYCLYLILLSLSSVNILLSLEQSLFYFRFGIFVIFSIYIFKNYKFVEDFFFKLIFIVCLLISIDGIIQFIFGYNILGFYKSDSFGRVTGVFNDEAVLGSYLSKVFPLLFFNFLTNPNSQKKYKIFVIILSLITIIISGERTATFFTIIFLFGYFIFSNKYSLTKKIFYIISVIAMLVIVINSNNNLKHRFINITLDQFQNNDGKILFFTKVHNDQFLAGYKIFLDNPVFGVGTKLYRHYACLNENYISQFSCTTHPHNTYIQLLSETGLVGTFIILFIFFFTIFKIFKYSFKFFVNKTNDVKICTCMAIFCFLWPVMPSGNFFNNWISILMYSNFIFYIRENL